MELILISAMTRDRIIGKDNALPWRIPDEYAHFLAAVRGHPVIIGRTSYEIFGGDLQDSPMIVVSRSLTEAAGAEVASSIQAALENAARHGTRVFSAGGATIYRETLPHATALWLPIVKGDYTGDTRFPEFDESDWKLTTSEDRGEFEFRVYERAT